MNRKQLYLIIIAVTIIFIILMLVFNAFFVYTDAKKLEITVNKLQPTVNDLARVLCDPINNRRLDVEEARIYCSDIEPAARE
jgi:uncharacterized membrane protein YvbJ